MNGTELILYIAHSNKHIKNLLEIINEFSKVMDTEPRYKNHMYFYILAMIK